MRQNFNFIYDAIVQQMKYRHFAKSAGMLFCKRSYKRGALILSLFLFFSCGGSIINRMDIDYIQKKISPVFERYGVKRARVFGSVSRGDDTPQSDVDILVELGKPMSLFTFMKMERELEEALGRKVDVVTEGSVNKHIKPYILKELRPLYG